MTWSFGLIALGTALLLVAEFRSIRRRGEQQRLRFELPGFVELYCSAIQSGISMTDAFNYMAEFKLVALEAEIKSLQKDLSKGRTLDQALDDFRTRLRDSEIDQFVSLLKIAHQSGSQNLISNLQSLSRELRAQNAAEGMVNAKLGAILIVAKLGLLAPWVLVALLSSNEQNRQTFLSDAGGLLLLAGFVISMAAYRLIVLAGRRYRTPRVLVGANG